MTSNLMTRNSNSFLANSVDHQTARLWDWIEITGDTPSKEFTFFEIPIGDPGHDGSQRTVLDTNMQLSHQLPAPRSFLLKRIMFTFSKGSHPEDVSDSSRKFHVHVLCREKTFSIVADPSHADCQRAVIADQDLRFLSGGVC